MADRLLRLDERPADIVIADQPELERDLGLLCITDGCRYAGVRYRRNEIGCDAIFSRQLPAEFLTNVVDVVAVEITVGTSEIDIFKNALGVRRGRKRVQRFHTARTEGNDLAGLDLANVIPLN